jgi:hypothetical protein
MGSEVVYLSNVIFELYKAALAGEITQDEFSTVKDIVKRARVVRTDDYDDLLKGWLNNE